MSKRNPNLSAPYIGGSFEPYESPVGDRGRVITSAKQRERDMQEHDCVATSDLPNKGQLDNAKTDR